MLNLDDGESIRIVALNMNRETQELRFWFGLGPEMYEVIHSLRPKAKDLSYVFTHGLRPQFVTAQELSSRAVAVQKNRWRVSLPILNALDPAYNQVPLPVDPNVSIFFAVRDRTGAMSDFVPLLRLSKPEGLTHRGS
jgi:hypothetical protein